MDLRKIKNSFILALACFTWSCEKEELPVKPHLQGDEEQNQVEIGEDYRNQLFFDLEKNEVVSSNEKTEWDLGFEYSSENPHVVLNSSKGMAAAISELNFEELTSISGLEWRWDAHSGNLDSTAIGDLQQNITYVIDRGYHFNGSHLGYFKFSLEILTEQEYGIRIGELTAIEGNQVVLPKNTGTFLTYFSYENGQVKIAPPDAHYDLVFTQYTHLFTDPLTPYLVTGVLLNRSGTVGIQCEEMTFEEVTLDDVVNLNLIENRDVIGYEWKYYNFDLGQYTVHDQRTYVIRSYEGYYYKLRFTGFYNQMGLKGYPSFEFQQL